MTWHLFLDESGDLGFDFENKNPSRFLTLSVLAVSQLADTNTIRIAVKKTLRRKVNGRKKIRKKPVQELKGTSTSLSVKKYFYEQVRELNFGIYSLSLDKQKVQSALQFTPKSKDGLYNYVARKNSRPNSISSGRRGGRANCR